MLEVEGLTVHIGGRIVVDGVSFSVHAGESLGLVGESGSGKSLTCAAVMGLLPRGARAEGSVRLDGAELLGASERALCAVRGARIGMVFQEPTAALDPLQRVGVQLTSTLRAHRLVRPGGRKRAAMRLAEQVGLPDPKTILRRYPHELSGGQRQRVMIAMAVAANPQLVLADEPTTALDVTVQARILQLLQEQASDRAAALVLVTHDMAVAAATTDRLIVMRNGRVVEQGESDRLLAAPQEEYTRRLVDAAYGTAWHRSGLVVSA